MTRAQVAALPQLGPIRREFSNPDGTAEEYRLLSDPICIFKDNALASVEIGRRAKDVQFGKIAIFAEPPRVVLKALESANGGAAHFVGSIMFHTLGINTGSFFFPHSFSYFDPASGEQDDRSINVFAKGEFDSMIGKFMPLELP